MEQENNIQQQQQQQSNSQVFKVMGMKTDLSESSFDNSFAFENKNMRINIVDDDNTLLNLTNEKGTKKISDINGIPIGLKKYDNNNAILISTTNEGGVNINSIMSLSDKNISSLNVTEDFDIAEFKDYFYKISTSKGYLECKNIKTYPNSTTNFSARNPLEIEHYGDGDKDFFYIVDGLNNMKKVSLNGDSLSSSEYNGLHITGNESISATKLYSASGEFFSGVIVYCFSYVTTIGHKTGIIDVSDCIMVSDFGTDSGNAPNTRCNICFRIKLDGVNAIGTDKIEIYSLFRSSLDGEIITRKVDTIKIKSLSTIEIMDYNLGEIISYQELLSRFNSPLVASTITQKNSTLFLGDIKTNNYQNLKDIISDSRSYVTLKQVEDNFVNRNLYYYGIQFQDIYGNWTPAIYINFDRNVKEAVISKKLNNAAVLSGYVAVRFMVLDNKRIRNTVCSGLIIPTIKIDNGKYGIDYYSPYSCEIKQSDIYKQTNRITKNPDLVYDLYSPDAEFDENVFIDENSNYLMYKSNVRYFYPSDAKINIEISGNTGTLYNNYSDKLGTSRFEDEHFLWTDSITGYQKALQLLWTSWGPTDNGMSANDIVAPLYDISKLGFKEEPTDYIIYMWQPNGSLNDSNGYTSVMKNKRISIYYSTEPGEIDCTPTANSSKVKLKLFDRTSNNVPVNGKVYAGIVNHSIYPSSWSIDEEYRLSNYENNDIDAKYKFWDEDQIPYGDNYSLAILDVYKYLGQPIQVYNKKIDDEYYVHDIWKYSAKTKTYIENTVKENQSCKGFQKSSTLGIITVNSLDKQKEKEGKEATGESIKVRVTNKFNRPGNTQMSYKTARHLIVDDQDDTSNNSTCYCIIVKDSEVPVQLTQSEIETGRWIVCSKKHKLNKITDNSDLIITDININEVYEWDVYESLKTEPYSTSDVNQVTCVLKIKKQKSYINPFCRYDKLSNMEDYNGVTSNVFNKLNLVYNQKNNFFVFNGITADTITDDTLENTILYSDMKVANENEDSFINFPNTNFYTIDSNVNKINKLITFNDKLLCFSDTTVVNILYNENVVINTDSVKSLGLASTDKITGTQLLSNSFGCLNKWSIGIYNNVLYFSDDLNNKLMSFSEGFSVINETLGIETLNNRLMKNNVWNPVDFNNTKLNIDKFSKDVHYTSKDIDIALNVSVGSFMSLFSYENVNYMDTVGNHSVAVRGNEVYALREGKYNYFFGKYEPYWTTVILNSNIFMNKTINNIEFNTEAYNDLIPVQNYTFDTVEFWNDYQHNTMNIDYKMYGMSSLKKKFRIWRVNMFRNDYRLSKRNYDFNSNPWSYMKLSSQKENYNKITLHWININYR